MIRQRHIKNGILSFVKLIYFYIRFLFQSGFKIFFFCLFLNLVMVFFPFKNFFHTLAEAAETRAPIIRSDVSGSWEFFKMIYRGQELDPINPSLHLYFDFNDPSVDRLYYYRDDEAGFCERLALYEYLADKKSLYQRVTWVNPQNQGNCGQDPDMRFGSESWTPISLRNGNLALEMPLGEESLIMLWRPVSDIPRRK